MMPIRLRLRSAAIALLVFSMLIIAGAGEPTSRPALERRNAVDTFRFRNQPIHPACVMQLGTELADALPTVAAVDVEGCKDSQQHPAAFTAREGWIRIGLKDGGWFAYRHVGVSPGGTHLLHTRFSGGGTGVFEDLLLVRFHEDRLQKDAKPRDRLLMTSVGSFTLGDRDDGEIRFEGSRIVVGRSRYRKQDTIVLLDAER